MNGTNSTNQTSRTAPPISGDDVTRNLLHNQMILTLVAIDAHRRIGPMLSISKLLCLWHTPTSSIPPQKQFKPNRPNNEKACTNSQLPFQPIGGIFIEVEADQQWKQLQAEHQQQKQKFYRLSPSAPSTLS